MIWSSFITWIAIIYVAYYAFTILFDMIQPSKNLAVQGEEDILHFSESVETTYVEEENVPVQVKDKFDDPDISWERNDEDTEEVEMISENINVSTGGVSQISELYKLAQSKAIEVKKGLVF
jgi:hypothetical protein